MGCFSICRKNMSLRARGSPHQLAGRLGTTPDFKNFFGSLKAPCGVPSYLKNIIIGCEVLWGKTVNKGEEQKIQVR